MSVSRDDLIGSWRLSAWDITQPDGRISRPFGEEPDGLITYGADGVMTATVCRRERAGFNGASPRTADEAAKSAAFDSYFHYAGRWRFDGAVVHHEVEFSLNPDFVGSTQSRNVDLTGATLTLSADEDIPGAGVRRHALVWTRR